MGGEIRTQEERGADKAMSKVVSEGANTSVEEVAQGTNIEG